MSKFHNSTTGTKGRSRDASRRSGQDPVKSVKPVSGIYGGDERRACQINSATRLHMPTFYPQFDSYVRLAQDRGEERARLELAEWLIQIGFQRNYRDEHIERAHLHPLVVVDEVIWRMQNHLQNKGPIENGIGWFLSVAKRVTHNMLVTHVIKTPGMNHIFIE